MAKKKIEVQGLSITIESIDNTAYISLTDIARQANAEEPRYVIHNWMRNSNSVRFLYKWEEVHNPDFKRVHLDTFLAQASDNRIIFTPEKWINKSGAIGMFSKRGRGGGTFAHSDIALEFCSWLSPEFKVYILKEFQRLKKEEYSRKNLQWHISKITNNIDEVRNLLDTIPGQLPELNRLDRSKEAEEEE